MQEREGIHVPRVRGSVGPFTCRNGKVARIEPYVSDLFINIRPGTGSRLSAQSARVQDGKPVCNGRCTLCVKYKRYFPGVSKLLWQRSESFTLERAGSA